MIDHIINELKQLESQELDIEIFQQKIRQLLEICNSREITASTVLFEVQKILLFLENYFEKINNYQKDETCSSVNFDDLVDNTLKDMMICLELWRKQYEIENSISKLKNVNENL